MIGRSLINPRLSVVDWFNNRKLVVVLGVDDQKLKVMDFFVCCKYFVFKIPQMN